MIPIKRPAVPSGHASRANKGTQNLWDEWKASGVTPTAKPSIYAHPSVKKALRQAQHDKCAFCETLNPTSHDVVEHFRPKNGWRQKRSDPLKKPSYFWLAYQWDNLVFACDRCNDGAHKGNLFPLSNPSQRANDSQPDVTKEKPLLINPYNVDPTRHIEWNRDVPRPHRGSKSGAKSIEIFGLDHDGLLMDQRRQYFLEVELSIKLVDVLQKADPLRKALVTKLLSCLGDAAPWAAMIRANFEGRIRSL